MNPRQMKKKLNQKSQIEKCKFYYLQYQYSGIIELFCGYFLPVHNMQLFSVRISQECKGCLASVGMAVWNCGTFEMDCIKGAIELGSECYPCVCEVIDALWPDDAPNCFKKEINKITKPVNNGASNSPQEDNTASVPTVENSSHSNEHDEL